MRKGQTFLKLETIVNLPKPDLQNEDVSLSELMIQSRQKRVMELSQQEHTNQEIANRINCSLRTVEGDLHHIRELSRSWFESESIKDYCYSLYDSIILCDSAIENLQILYSEYDDLESKIKIFKTILDFEERKTEIYHKTRSVQKYCEELTN